MMDKMRHSQRECKDKDKIENFLKDKRVGTLSMIDKNGNPYAVPLNYVYYDNKIYIHGMGSGKKNEILSEKNDICFTIFEEFGTVTDNVPCKCDTSYFSVIIFGKAVLVEDLEEKTKVLMEILNKFMPEFFKSPMSQNFVDKYRSGHDNKAVAIYSIDLDKLSAKENPINLENMFKMMGK